MIAEPSIWIIAFHRRTPHWWLRWVGRYKHVSAFAWVSEAGCWLLYEVALTGTRLVLVGDDDEMAGHTVGADLLRITRVRQKRTCLAPFSCVSAVAHLIGLRCGCFARPDTLWRQCLRNGGEVIGSARTVTDDRSATPAAATAVRGGPHRGGARPALERGA